MRFFSYVVRWDHGFAPNPFYGICTVATCKPGIRKAAAVGDFILGTGSAARNLAGRATFLMRVEKIVDFNAYWSDPKFSRKIPVMNGSLQQRFGDNIYHRVNGKWVQTDSRHSQVRAKPNLRNLRRDTSTTDRVLIGSEFTYWGGYGPRIPQRLSGFVHAAPGYRASFSPAEMSRFLKWLGEDGATKGMIGEPIEWRFEKFWR